MASPPLPPHSDALSPDTLAPETLAPETLSIQTLSRASDISAQDWDDCAGASTRFIHPLLRHDFFVALEESGSACAETGWVACHQIVKKGDTVLAVMPLYLKTHSQGEYVFDHAWAEAFQRAGGQYYPKLLSAVPFSPVTGPRFLIKNPSQSAILTGALIDAALAVLRAHNLSSFHLNFLQKKTWADLEQYGFLLRKDQQFHWHNNQYSSFDDFLQALNARKRKNLKKERAQAVAAGISIEWLSGPDLRDTHWDDFFTFYLDTSRRKWGSPYLTRSFFDEIHHRMADNILLIMAKRDGRYIAGALNFIGNDTLYGRNWGCVEDHPFLHFELCYYQAIDFAIERGLTSVEAGAQGAHKIARGYVPQATYSAHYIAHEGFRDAVAHYLESEREYVDNDMRDLRQFAPFKESNQEKP